ncbi:hypothetical protein F2Q68_00019261 [Brassica cretica]|uniref:At2g35280-like TPR domain-containing protein n=1 Tax=Brassica cretica TaxID=69181 RepID=A0A8S9FZK7_BRACR|nr:hypothetical protein F2Q68_00019261 [Brassica cretica]
MASTSPIHYFNTIITCKRLSFGPDNYSIAKALNLSPLVNQPSLANRYQTLVDRCLETNNIDAHFVKGMLEYFESQNQIIGLHHIHIASKGGHVQGTYVYGVLLMAIGETENGVKIINKLTDDKRISVVEDCMANFQRSMERPFLHMKETYLSSSSPPVFLDLACIDRRLLGWTLHISCSPQRLRVSVAVIDDSGSVSCSLPEDELIVVSIGRSPRRDQETSRFASKEDLATAIQSSTAHTTETTAGEDEQVLIRPPGVKVSKGHGKKTLASDGKALSEF